MYSGVGAFCASNAAKSGIRFLTFDLVKDRLPRDPETGKHTATSSMLAGVAAGIAESVTVVTPGENLKTKTVEDRAGARQFKTTAAVVRGIVAKDGLMGLFRGVVPVTMKQASNALVRFSSYQALLDIAQPNLERGGWGTLAPAIAGAGAGVITVYATMPFDVVKTKMQSIEGRQQYGGTWRCILAIAQQSGLSGFWRGTTPRLVRLSVSQFSLAPPRNTVSLADVLLSPPTLQVSGAISFSIYSWVVVTMQSRTRVPRQGAELSNMVHR